MKKQMFNLIQSFLLSLVLMSFLGTPAMASGKKKAEKNSANVAWLRCCAQNANNSKACQKKKKGWAKNVCPMKKKAQAKAEVPPPAPVAPEADDAFADEGTEN